jgi:hypothetical protein
MTNGINMIDTSPSRILFEEASLDEFLLHISESAPAPLFCEYLEFIRKTYGINKEELFTRSSVSSSYGHEIFKGFKTPTRNKVLQFCFGLRAGITEAQKLLWLSGHALLYPQIERDALIMTALAAKNSIINVNLDLSERGMPLLCETK